MRPVAAPTSSPVNLFTNKRPPATSHMQPKRMATTTSALFSTSISNLGQLRARICHTNGGST